MGGGRGAFLRLDPVGLVGGSSYIPSQTLEALNPQNSYRKRVEATRPIGIAEKDSDNMTSPPRPPENTPVASSGSSPSTEGPHWHHEWMV